MQPTTQTHETWSSRFVFLLAAIGAAVGLGNMWRFPYTAGESGGGAFVLVYFLAIVLVAVPVVMSELLIGRRGRLSPVNSFRRVSAASGGSTRWAAAGWLNVSAGFLILTFYSVIAGWGLAYILKVAGGTFTNAGTDAVSKEFGDLLASPWTLTGWHAAFMALTIFIVGRGVQKGIETAVKVLMPSLFVMLLALVGYAGVEGDFPRAVAFLFEADFSKITPSVILEAAGQAFFSVSVAMGLMMAYGAYLPDTVSIPRAALIIAAADTLVALLAGLAIFPLVFANNLDPASGPGLLFVALPNAFGAMPGGQVFGTLFFVLLVFAALTSSIALLEPIVSWAEEHKGVKRGTSALIAGSVAWLIGLASVLSLNHWKEFHPLGFIKVFKGQTIFDLLDYFASNVMLLLGGIVIAVFGGWVMSRSDTREELQLKDAVAFKIWLFLVRYFVPVAVALVLVNFIYPIQDMLVAVGLLDADG